MNGLETGTGLNGNAGQQYVQRQGVWVIQYCESIKAHGRAVEGKVTMRAWCSMRVWLFGRMGSSKI